MSNRLKLDVANCLANLDMLIGGDQIDELKICHFGTPLRFTKSLAIVEIFHHISTLKVKHLKLTNLDFFPSSMSASMPTDSVLVQITLSRCANFIDILKRIFLSHAQLTSLTIKNHVFNQQSAKQLAVLLLTNYRLREINYELCPYARGILVETSQEVVNRNQRMHDNCIDAVMTILLAQKSKVLINGFKVIGRDCTRIIVKYVLVTKYSLEWLNC